jgi:hypothetical protein
MCKFSTVKGKRKKGILYIYTERKRETFVSSKLETKVGDNVVTYSYWTNYKSYFCWWMDAVQNAEIAFMSQEGFFHLHS